MHFSLALLLLAAGCAGSRVTALKTADAVTKESAKDAYDAPTISRLASAFSMDDFSDKRLKLYSDVELNRLYAALSAATFYFPEHADQVAMQENVFKEKSARNTCGKSDVRDMYKTYLGARMFDKASAIRKQFPDIKLYSMPEKIISDPLPSVTAWRVYNVPDEGKTIELTASQLGKGPKIAMLILPGCEVSETAMKSILDDPELGPVFRRQGTVLTNRVNAETVALWKSHFGFPEVYLTYKASDFPGFDFDSSPTFYFLVDGKIKYSFTGWNNKSDPNHGKTEMLKGLAAISRI